MTHLADLPRVRAVTDWPPGPLMLPELIAANAPVVLKGYAANWPLVAAGRAGPAAAMAYIQSFDGGRPIVGFTADPAARGRFFYSAGFDGFNFRAERVALADYFARIAADLGRDGAPAYYVGSTDLDTFLPGLRGENDLALTGLAEAAAPPLVSIWMGTQTTAATHYDMSNNLACCMVGRRRFTLFPPSAIADLYPGPLEPTPAGQVVSMVDLSAPDFDRYPRFRNALAAAQVAELEPGDVLFYPAMWWHNVEALGDFTAMINYWWNDTPPFVDTPQITLLHALLSLRDRPAHEKAAWRALFDYYVFGDADQAGAHVPAHARGPLERLDTNTARRLRAQIIQRLNR